jgi:hypothetical protein
MNDSMPPAAAMEPQPIFDFTEALLKAGGNEILDWSRSRGTIETKYACYSTHVRSPRSRFI